MQVLALGTRIEKTNSDAGDGHADGAPGRVVAVLGPVADLCGYFIEWDDLPGLPVFIGPDRIRAAPATYGTVEHEGQT